MNTKEPSSNQITTETLGKFSQKITPRIIQKILILTIHSLFLLASAYLVYMTYTFVPTIKGEKVWVYFYLTINQVTTFYLFSLLFFPVIIVRKQLKKNILFAVVTLVAFIALESFLSALKSAAITLHEDGTPTTPFDFLSIWWIMGASITFVPVGVIAFIYSMVIHLVKKSHATFESLLGRKNTELKLLKSQVNPHFLFNSLNTIYATALEEGSDKTANTASKLSNLIRYMIQDIHQDFIPLEKEAKYIRDYINIQLQRCSAKQDVELQIEGTENKRISPGLLIPFIENAFKHGIHPAKSSSLFVKIAGDDKSIAFECTNSISGKSLGTNESLGIGIENVKQRLRLVYPKQHTFEVERKGGLFKVILTISAI